MTISERMKHKYGERLVSLHNVQLQNIEEGNCHFVCCNTPLQVLEDVVSTCTKCKKEYTFSQTNTVYEVLPE